MPRQLGIRAGEHWAYKTSLRYGPLVEVEVIDPGSLYESNILVRLIDTGESIWTRRPRLPAKWADRERYLASHPRFAAERPRSAPEPALPKPQATRLTNVDLELIREVVRDEIETSMRGVPRLAFSVAELAYAIGVSDQQIYNHIKRNDLTPRYSGTKAIIPVDEALRFIRELPDEAHGPLV